MCRMVGYVGTAIAPADLLTRPPHSLSVQSYKPREMTSGTVNADGFGAALWLDDGIPEPALYRTAAPIWADPNLGWMGERLRATALLAAVRSATPGIGYELSNVQPFARGRLAFVHNGFVEKFRHGPQRALREGLGQAAYESIAGTSDSEHIFALVLDELDRGARLPDALRGALSKLGHACEAHHVSAVATIILCDGEQLLACRWSRGTRPASLYGAALQPGGRAADARDPRGPTLGFAVASEPLDQASWTEVREQKLVAVGRGGALREEGLS